MEAVAAEPVAPEPAPAAEASAVAMTSPPAEGPPADEAAPAAPLQTPRELLREARDQKLPVEGKVLAQRGSLGLDVDLGGGILALCPKQEIDIRHSENPGKLVGETLKFLVKDVDEREVILSRRSLLELESYARVTEARKRAVPGAVLRGRVTSVREFGAFVDLGGLEGLVHVSELSHDRGARPQDLVSVGQELEVMVLEVKREPGKSDRISLSRKAREPSAWDKAVEGLAEGAKLKGRVTKLLAYGAFIEIAPGVNGLAHVSALSPKRIGSPSEVVKEGDEVDVELIGVDREKRRIALRRLPTEDEAKAAEGEREERRQANREKRQKAKERRELAKKKPHERYQVGEVVQTTVDRIEPYGLFVKLEHGGRGMIHVSETGIPKGADLAKEIPPGTKLSAAVVQIETEPTPRIRLSRVAAEKIAAGGTLESYQAEKALVAASERAHELPARRAGPRGPKTPRPPGEGARAEARAGGRGRGAGERPQREAVAPTGPRQKPGKLGTLGDLFRAKLDSSKK
ncbi:MAG: S1 RNA-binding domain-containing protein [Deltaproteobacteria bacterium]